MKQFSRIGGGAEKRTKDNSTRTEQLVLMTTKDEFIYNSYNQLTVLQKNIDKVFGRVPLITECIGLFLIVLNLFLAVTFKDLSALVKALVFLYIFLTYFSRLARVYSSSTVAIQSWREILYQGLRRNEGTVFSKFLKSVRPLSASIGDFFFIDQPFILTFVAIIVDQTINLIISYN